MSEDWEVRSRLGPPGQQAPAPQWVTAEEARSKQFTPVRLREGYAMGEVDDFVDQVAATLAAMEDRAAELASAPTVYTETFRSPAPADVEPVPVVVQTTDDASRAAVRLLELAVRDAEQVADEAKAQAATLLEEAKAEAAAIRTDSQHRIRKDESDARGRVARLDEEIHAKRETMMADLQRERGELTKEVDYLRATEREAREKLRVFHTARLAELDPSDPVVSDR